MGRLREAPDRATRTSLFASHLARRLSNGPPPNADVARAMKEIHRHGGRLTMRALSQRVAIPERRLERLFSEHAGVSPKQLSRIARVQRALSVLDDEGGSLSWGQFAMELGFADQAHFIREFKVLTGVTPARYAGARALSDSFNTAPTRDLT
jgi:AraC-like DNA-binding protein